MLRLVMPILAVILLAGCATTPNDDFGAYIERTNEPGVFIGEQDFIMKHNDLFHETVLEFPGDKQKHAHISKGLFTSVPVTDTDTSFGQGVYAFLQTLEIGYEKEMKDRGVPLSPEHKAAWSNIYTGLIALDKIAKKERLDQGDLNADLFGVLSAYLPYVYMELE